MIRILHAINWFRRGGVETQLLQILRDYDRFRFHMDVVCFGVEIGYLAPEAKKLGTEVLHCPKSINLHQFSNRFNELIDKRKYDVVHCHSELWSGPILRGAKYANIPVRIGHIRINVPQGLTIRSPFLKFWRYFAMVWGRYWLLNHASHIMGVSAAALDARFHRWKNNDMFSLWTLGIDTQKFSLQNEEKMTGRKNPVIVNVASFSPQKRQELLLKVLALVLAQLPKARLILVGEGSCLDRCKQLAKNSGSYDHVDFLGLRENIPDLLHGADIFVSCSEAEGLPNVLLEAQASGLPVVASDIPPHREAIPEVAHQFLFKHNDLQMAANNIVRILNEPQLYRRLRDEGRKHVCNRYDSRKNLPKLEEMYCAWCRGAESIA